ncbi:MAG: isoprenyl transferase [Proteobacteria bacterium]|nr:isoprenyl transferase [Pseudomonadota bacterium]
MPSDDRTTIDPEKIPVHVAIIMDGNGRWAKKKLLNRVKGHEKGSDTVRTIVRVSRELGVRYLTLYAFSTENWGRPKAEVMALMSLLKKFIHSEKKEMMDHHIRLNALGQIHRLPGDVKETLKKAMDETRDNDGMCLNLALSYGSRDEITEMVRAIADKVKHGEIPLTAITEDMIASHLFTAGMPDPDLMIRTSGEMRISNFLMWQLSYAEIYFTPTLWPDFSEKEYLKIIADYQGRDRRFGKVAE